MNIKTIIQQSQPKLSRDYLQEWHKFVGKGDDERWQQRLSWETPATDDSFPQWAKILEKISLTPSVNEPNMETDIIFSELFTQFYSFAQKELEKKCPYIFLLLSTQAYQILIHHLIERLALTATPTLKQHFVMFQRKHNPEIKISFNKKANIYQKFIRTYTGQKFIELWQQYPVLAQLFGKITLYWLEFTHELLERLKQDWEELIERFATSECQQVTRISLGVSDCHQQGRSVVIFVFNDNTQIIYKPKSLDIDKAFYGFTQWCGSYGLDIFVPVKLITKDGYGWMEYFENQPLYSKKYFERLGVLQCIFYAFTGSDFHEDNILSIGEFPLPIDLETLMTPELEDGPFWKKQATNISILRTHLLNTNEQYSSFAKIMASNRDYRRQFIRGISTAYHFFVANRKLVIEQFSKYFVNVPVRLIFQNTQVYYKLLIKSIQPEYLHDGIRRNIVLEFLYRNLFFLGEPEKFSKLTKVEIDMLWQMDIPYFVIGANECELYEQKILIESPYQNALNNIQSMNLVDLKRQIYTISECLKLADDKNLEISPLSLSGKTISSKNILREIDLIAEEIANLAMIYKNTPSWLTPSRNYLQVSDYFLYEGRIGIALFFAARKSITEDKIYDSIIHKILQPILETTNRERWLENFLYSPQIGYSGGIAGVIYSLFRIGKFTVNASLVDAALQIAHNIPLEKLDYVEDIDIGEGWSGFILVWLMLYKDKPDAVLLEQATKACGYLVQILEKSTDLKNGFFHGYAGVAYALLSLYKYNQKPIWKQWAQRLITIEQAIYTNQKQNDFYLRYCSGISGIGMARIAQLQQYENEKIYREIELALKACKGSSSIIDTACCGLMGHVELFLVGAEYLCSDYYAEAQNKVSQLLQRKSKHNNFLFGSAVTIPGLFGGLAGIGYQLLRSLYPKKIPSFLLVE